MKIKKEQNGFILMVVLSIISLFAAEMYMLSEDSFSLMFQTNNIYLEAVEKNLVLSGLAWSKENIRDEENKIGNKTIQLNLPAGFPGESKLDVFIEESSGDHVRININAYCRFVKQARKIQRIFIID